ncbi:DUF1900-domain-containing protein [Jaminaea rosea]|uniref:DUF1900-domain-containing protein n=1 Tax=Jaminaea rosea TaxID=1569628 RepID=A0A316UYV5_9BASI|nr:DUF1900-domain-containing protein [Jaminaea rosea]PWN30480.1 DUF1900-domain-containing protein [Jaminaea rosea]
MPPSRFAALSPWRNLAAKPTQSYSEVSIAPTSDAVGGDTIAASSRCIYVKASTPSTLIVLDQGEEHTGKLAGKSRTITLPCNVCDIAVSPFRDDCIAIGGEDGSIIILKDDEIVAQRKHQDTQQCLVRWHPHASDLVLSASAFSSQVHLWDLEKDSNGPATSLHVDVGSKAGGKFVWDVQWSNDGSKIVAALADGTVKILNARDGLAVASSNPPSFGLPKPMRVAHVGSYVLASTLTSSRQRELRIFAIDSLSSPLQTITLDTASSPLALAVDQDRRLVYMGAKGDVTMRWIELDDSRKFPQGAFPLPPRTSFAALSTTKPISLDVMSAEIDRLYVASASGSEVVPISIEIPQRQLIDYHSHLFPDTYDGSPALTASDWLQGKDGEMTRVSMDPSKRGEWAKPKEIHIPQQAKPAPLQEMGRQPSGSPFEPTKASSVPPPAVVDPSVQVREPASPLAPTSLTPTLEATSLATTSKTRDADTAAQISGKDGSSSAPPPQRYATAQKPRPHTTAWSRATLAGSTPLLSAFTSVPAVDASISPAARSFLSTPSHLLYPLAGPGGRLAFHELARAGRMPEAKDISWIETGGKVFDFTSDPFDSRRVVTMADDGVKVWRLPAEPGPDSEYEQRVVTTAEATVALPNELGRGSNVAFHPTASDVLLVAGSEGLCIIDLSSSSIIQKLGDTSVAGEAEWSPNGSLVAFARSTDRKLVIWNPHTAAVAEVAAHDSPRPFKIAWVDESHVATVGHTFGSMRQVKLFSLSDDFQLQESSKLGLDTSPAILFPHYDPDAALLYLWSKGERSISVLHVMPPSSSATQSQGGPVFKLLSGAFQHSHPQIGVSFLPKRYADVREVEVAVSYRLSKNNEVQRVGWRVERKRKEFFQDDVFPPTVDVEQPLLSAAEWAEGREPPASRPVIDLCPAGMKPLSAAPPPEPTGKSTLPKQPTQRILDEKEREEQLMSGVFARAKVGASEAGGNNGDPEDELEQTAARKRAPVSDDWGDDD